jgi:hypothetical protein
MVSGVRSEFKNCSQQADTVLSMVDHVAGTGIMLWRFLEGEEGLP